MTLSAFYQTITISFGFFFYGAMFVKLGILTPLQCFLFGSSFIFLALLRNRIDNQAKKSQNKVFFEHIYNFYSSVNEYVDWYDSDHESNFIEKQKQYLDELEKYIEINENILRSRVVKQADDLKKSLNEIVSTLWTNAQHSDQTKRYEVWENIKFNVMENEIKPFYEQFKKSLKVK